MNIHVSNRETLLIASCLFLPPNKVAYENKLSYFMDLWVLQMQLKEPVSALKCTKFSYLVNPFCILFKKPFLPWN